jgi:hypothetical protein
MDVRQLLMAPVRGYPVERLVQMSIDFGPKVMLCVLGQAQFELTTLV